MSEWSDLFRETIKLFAKLILGAISVLVFLWMCYCTVAHMVHQRIYG